MSLPTPGDVHVNRPLTSMSVAYMQSLEDFVADKVAPIVMSDKQSDSYFIFTKDFWFRDEMKVRAPGTAAAIGGYGITTGSYHCPTYAIAKDVSDKVRRNSDNPLNPDRNAMQYLARQERIRREKAFAAACLAANVWTTTATGVADDTPSAGEVNQWSDADSTPIEDILAYKSTVKLLTGMMPNHFTCGQQVWDALVRHPDILALISGGSNLASPSLVNRQLVAKAFEIDEICVMSAVENTAAEGATYAGAYIGGKKGLLTYRTPNAQPTVEDASAVVTFAWRDEGTNEVGARIRQFRMEELGSDRIEIESSFTHKVLAPDLGVYFPTLVA